MPDSVLLGEHGAEMADRNLRAHLIRPNARRRHPSILVFGFATSASSPVGRRTSLDGHGRGERRN